MLVGIMACAYGQLKLYKIVAIGLMIASIYGIVLLFRVNKTQSKINILDLAVSLIVVFLNRQFLGLIFGWVQCPMI